MPWHVEASRRAHQRASRKVDGLRVVLGGGIRSRAVLGFFPPTEVFTACIRHRSALYYQVIEDFTYLIWDKERPQEHQAHIDFYESGDAGLVNMQHYIWSVLHSYRNDLVDRMLERFPDADYVGTINVYGSEQVRKLLEPYLPRLFALKSENSESDHWVSHALHVFGRYDGVLQHLVLYVSRPYVLASHCWFCKTQVGLMGWTYD